VWGGEVEGRVLLRKTARVLCKLAGVTRAGETEDDDATDFAKTGCVTLWRHPSGAALPTKMAQFDFLLQNVL